MKPPRIPSLFKLSKYNEPKRFNYKPRVYDERKENLDKRKKAIEKEMEREGRLGKDYEAHLRESIHDSWARRETRRQNRNSGRRLLLILAALVVIMYFIFTKYDLTF